MFRVNCLDFYERFSWFTSQPPKKYPSIWVSVYHLAIRVSVWDRRVETDSQHQRRPSTKRDLCPFCQLFTHCRHSATRFSSSDSMKMDFNMIFTGRHKLSHYRPTNSTISISISIPGHLPKNKCQSLIKPQPSVHAAHHKLALVLSWCRAVRSKTKSSLAAGPPGISDALV